MCSGVAAHIDKVIPFVMDVLVKNKEMSNDQIKTFVKDIVAADIEVVMAFISHPNNQDLDNETLVTLFNKDGFTARVAEVGGNVCQVIRKAQSINIKANNIEKITVPAQC